MAEQPLTKIQREKIIRDFFDKAGGTKNLARTIGSTMNALNICKNRGVLSRSNKYEFKQAASAIKFELPDEIFNPLQG